MDLTCYLYPGWEPRIRPASTRRTWMDAAPEAYPYRCLPLAIANSHGWEVLSPCGFEVEWNGGTAPEDVTVRPDEGIAPELVPVALFGLGTFTIHIQGLFRTPPEWNLFVSGPPNAAKDGVSPLSGLIETDWSPYTFTMNWQLTRPGQTVRFEENEPIAFFFPVQRGAAAQFTPRFQSIEDAPELKSSFEAWSHARDAFQKKVAENPPSKPSDKWQKLYYRGLMPDGKCPFPGHESKLALREFAHAERAGGAAEAMQREVAPKPPQPAQPADTGEPAANTPASKSEWILNTLAAQADLSPEGSGIHKREGLNTSTFLAEHYAASRPVVLAGEMASWPALSKWTPDYLRMAVGSAEIEFQDARTTDPDFERYKDNHLTRAPFDTFLDRITTEEGNCAYLTAYNAHRNLEALAPLDADVGRLETFLDYSRDLPGGHGGMIWIGPAGTKTSLHHDLTNNFLAQVTGRKRVILAAPSQTPNLYNDHHVFSRVRDVTDPDLDLSRFPRLAQVTFHDVVLEPGEILFIPVGWWHQVEALDFSVSMTFTNFLWRNSW